MDKFKIQKELSNYNAWVSGLYVFEAVSRSLYNSFGRKNGQQAINYIEKPYDFDAKPKTKEELEREERLKVEAQIKERNKKIKQILQEKQKEAGENNKG